MDADLTWHNATAADVATAWKAWDAGKPLTPQQMGLLRETTDGARDLLPPRAEAELAARQAQQKRTMPGLITKGHEGAPASVRLDLTAEQMGELLAEAIKPLQRRLDAAEAEIKAGHARIKKLEARHD